MNMSTQVTAVGAVSALASSGGAETANSASPIDMVLHCPACRMQHVDSADERMEIWGNPPHRSHLCHGCGHIWRPADVPTNGVAATKTVGKADSAPTSAQAVVDAQELVDKIADMFGIGSEARKNTGTVLENLKNTMHFADLLHAVEREFFMVPAERDEDYPDEDPGQACLVNSWGSTTEQYLAQFRAAFARCAHPVAHPDDLAVDSFAASMKAKMAASRAKDRSGWDDPARCTVETLSEMLLAHVRKGDPVDVANFCMMLHQREAGIVSPAAQAAGLTDVDLDLCRQWFSRVQDTNPQYLQKKDYELAKRLHARLGIHWSSNSEVEFQALALESAPAGGGAEQCAECGGCGEVEAATSSTGYMLVPCRSCNKSKGGAA